MLEWIRDGNRIFAFVCRAHKPAENWPGIFVSILGLVWKSAMDGYSDPPKASYLHELSHENGFSDEFGMALK